MSFNIMTLPSRIQIAEVTVSVRALVDKGLWAHTACWCRQILYRNWVYYYVLAWDTYIYPLCRIAYGVIQDCTLGTVVLRKGANVRDKIYIYEICYIKQGVIVAEVWEGAVWVRKCLFMEMTMFGWYEEENGIIVQVGCQARICIYTKNWTPVANINYSLAFELKDVNQKMCQNVKTQQFDDTTF